ncbi:hypothetical protein [Faecalicatena contorta]|nr:hypothetical protein [Faecalicatena contorta]
MIRIKFVRSEQPEGCCKDSDSFHCRKRQSMFLGTCAAGQIKNRVLLL